MLCSHFDMTRFGIHGWKRPLFAFIIPICFFPVDSIAGEATAVHRIIIPYFKPLTANKRLKSFIKKNRSALQKEIVSYLRKKSNLETVPVGWTAYAKTEGIMRVAKRRVADGILVGAFYSKVFQGALLSAQTGHELVRWSFSLPKKMKLSSYKLFMRRLCDSIIESIPYRGYITSVKGKIVKLNMGRKDVLAKGDRLRVFDFYENEASFSDRKQYLGKIEIVSTRGKTARAKIVSKKRKIKKYAKIAFKGAAVAEIVPSENRYGSRFWLGLGGQGLYINSEASEANAKILKREYQVTLTQLSALLIGYGPLAIESLYGTAGNQFHNIEFLIAEASFEFIKFRLFGLDFFTSPGFRYASYAVTNKTVVVALVSSEFKSPQVEQRVQYHISPRATVIGITKVFLPILSSDAENGDSQLATSYGFGLKAGLRLKVGRKLHFENMIGSQFSVVQFENEQFVREGQFYLEFKGLYFF